MAEATATPNNTNFQVSAKIRQHEVLLDEPEEKGGGDTAPTPTELVCASLAACTTITLQMYIQHKGWEASVKSVNVVYETIDGIGTFRRQVVLQGHTPEQLPRLTSVANSCPIHKLLSKANPIDTRIR
ncbi:OsmC family protein [Imperialibacter roseus]|uniref:OsmC family protein n=1 Tax=Imperialibacter roseus TaxID=1324217 RepID=A0ABZ0ITB7_9BACT|nr:OsmC family protein [Imperialibacter roseus]WOK08011.1 OsmC family protein [Imperialibacter roseus]|tara:strand:- start:26023 stop:26406 length:384 start_codon:yes stop_codon:yes gene_type:complete